MTSDQKTNAYLARRVGKVEENQAKFKAVLKHMNGLMERFEDLQIQNQKLANLAFESLTVMKEHLTRNEKDHRKILRHLGIIE